MKDYILEGCVDSVESAIIAGRGGCNRLELCSNLIIGGTTPGRCLYDEVRKNCNIKVHALIRPRFGDFCYSEHEFNVIKEEVKMFRELGADGVVIGILRPEGSLNMEQMAELMELTGDMSVTLHRAFDVCRNPFETMKEAIKLGINTILTSGQKNSCQEGKELLGSLVEKADGRISILAAGGVSAETIPEVYAFAKTSAFHMSGKITKDSEMVYRKTEINMGLPCLSEYEIWQTDENRIRAAREILESL